MYPYFRCSGRNPEGKPPRFPQKPTISQKGEVLSMECILEALPVADITWYHGQDTITDGDRFKILRKAISNDTYLLTLQISQPTANDGGIYRCHAFNPFGESNAHITLNFKGIFKFSFFVQLCSQILHLNSPTIPSITPIKLLQVCCCNFFLSRNTYNVITIARKIILSFPSHQLYLFSTHLS